MHVATKLHIKQGSVKLNKRKVQGSGNNRRCSCVIEMQFCLLCNLIVTNLANTVI